MQIPREVPPLRESGSKKAKPRRRKRETGGEKSWKNKCEMEAGGTRGVVVSPNTLSEGTSSGGGKTQYSCGKTKPAPRPILCSAYNSSFPTVIISLCVCLLYCPFRSVSPNGRLCSVCLRRGNPTPRFVEGTSINH